MSETSYEWAVRVHGLWNGEPGPHLLECREDERLAHVRLESWREKWPEAQAELLRRTVVTTRGEWEAA